MRAQLDKRGGLRCGSGKKGSFTAAHTYPEHIYRIIFQCMNMLFIVTCTCSDRLGTRRLTCITSYLEVVDRSETEMA